MFRAKSIEYKECPVCRQLKPLSEYSLRAAEQTPRPECQSCYLSYQRTYAKKRNVWRKQQKLREVRRTLILADSKLRFTDNIGYKGDGRDEEFDYFSIWANSESCPEELRVLREDR